MSFIMRVLGLILETLYTLVQNYGISILLFTIIVKLILLPLTIKQQKSMLKTQKLQPMLMELQKKYGNDKEKLNMETMKLYQTYKINPMSGCLPMFIQLPIIFALYWVVRKPITYIIGVDASEIWRIFFAFTEWAQNGGASVVAENLKNITIDTFGGYEIEVAQYMRQFPEILNHPYIAQWDSQLKVIDFNFLGLNLAGTPNLGALFNLCFGKIDGLNLQTILLWIIPVFSGLTTWLSTKITMASTNNNNQAVKKPNSDTSNPADSMKMMNKIMPLFTAWFTFSVPAAVGLYWITSNILQIVQQFVINKVMGKEIEKEIDIETKGVIANAKKNNKKRKKS